MPESELAHGAALGRVIGPVQEERAYCKQYEDLPRLPQDLRDRVFTEEACDCSGDRRHDYEPGHALVGRLDASPTDRGGTARRPR